MTGLLASVNSLAEARLALQAGADIIDMKDPATGALGALPVDAVRTIVRHIAGVRPSSATIGDVPLHDPQLASRIMAMHVAGLDYVKVGLFGELTSQRLAVLRRCAARGVAIVLVCFVDRCDMIPDRVLLAAAGIKGVMLDTANKTAGPLTAQLDERTLAAFVQSAKAARLLCGLAGSLRPADVPPLLPLRADYLGFRGALCRRRDRTAVLDAAAIVNMKQLFSRQANALATVERDDDAIEGSRPRVYGG